MRFLKADQVFDGTKMLSADQVLVLDNNNFLKEIIRDEQAERSNVETIQGILTPGFVNAHCHLELSHLRNKIPASIGLTEFAKRVITGRNSFPAEEIREAITIGDGEMWKNGIVAVGDISNTDDSFACKASSKIKYHTFIELLGFDPGVAPMVFERGLALLKSAEEMALSGSLAAHSPYGSSHALISLISNFDLQRGLPFSIHNQESAEETKLFYGVANKFKELYDFLKIDISHFKPPGFSSLRSYVDTIVASPSLLVHNTQTKSEDLTLVANKNIFFCFCPYSNQYIEESAPDLSLFKPYQDRICLGTDSLASNETLDVLKDANLLLEKQSFGLEPVLAALTFNGARALNLSEKFGKFIPGKNTGLNHLSYTNSKLQLIKKIA